MATWPFVFKSHIGDANPIWIHKLHRIPQHIVVHTPPSILLRQRIHSKEPPNLRIVQPCAAVVIAGLLVALVAGGEVAFAPARYGEGAQQSAVISVVAGIL